MTGSRSPRRFALVPLVVAATALTAACTSTGGGFGPAATADPDTLIGLAPEQISDALGAPELQRREPPAEVWQYRTQICVFDLYLHDEDGASRAIHYEARSRSNGEIDPAECLGSVVERPRLASTEEAVPADPAQL